MAKERRATPKKVRSLVAVNLIDRAPKRTESAARIDPAWMR